MKNKIGYNDLSIHLCNNYGATKVTWEVKKITSAFARSHNTFTTFFFSFQFLYIFY